MPDYSGSAAEHASWVTAGDPVAVLSALRAALDGRNARISDHTEASFEAVLGSRARFRFMGLFSPSKIVPIRVTVSVRAAPAGSHVDLAAASDEGRYLLRVDRLADGIYAEAFASLFAELKGAVTPVN